jgi:Ca2+-binding EF-hand superfamily protein
MLNTPDTGRESISSLLSKSSVHSKRSNRSHRSNRSISSSKSRKSQSTKKSNVHKEKKIDPGLPTRYDNLHDSDGRHKKEKKRKKGPIKDERLRKINATATGEEFLTNAQLEELGDQLVDHARHARTDEALKILKGDVDCDRKDWKHFFWTSAHWACRHNDIRLLRALHEAGADMEIGDRPDNWMPATVAAKFNAKECLHFLVEEVHVNVHARCDKGLTPFHWACGQGHLGAAIMIANLSDKELKERELAMSVCDREMRVYLEKLPKHDDNVPDVNGVVPLHEAAAGGHLEVVRWLAEARNVDVAKKDYLGASCLDFAKRRKGLGKLKNKETSTIAERKLLTDSENTLCDYVKHLLIEAENKRLQEKAELRKKILLAERARRIELGLPVTDLNVDDDDAIVDLETGEVTSKKELAEKLKKKKEEEEQRRILEEGAETATELFAKLGITEKETMQFQKIYNKIDDDHSEEITANELYSFLGMEPTPFACRVFSMMDDSGDGTVDFEEFCSMLTLFCSISSTSLVSFAFSLYDSDGSQTLERDELERMMSEVYGKKWESNKKTKKILHEMDEDGDSCVDLGEFEDACKKYAYLLKPAFDMQNILREKTLGTTTWKKISKKQNEIYGKDFTKMMNKLSGKETLIAERLAHNEAAKKILKEQDDEEEKELKRNMKKGGTATPFDFNVSQPAP